MLPNLIFLNPWQKCLDSLRQGYLPLSWDMREFSAPGPFYYDRCPMRDPYPSPTLTQLVFVAARFPIYRMFCICHGSAGSAACIGGIGQKAKMYINNSYQPFPPIGMNRHAVLAPPASSSCLLNISLCQKKSNAGLI